MDYDDTPTNVIHANVPCPQREHHCHPISTGSMSPQNICFSGHLLEIDELAQAPTVWVVLDDQQERQCSIVKCATVSGSRHLKPTAVVRRRRQSDWHGVLTRYLRARSLELSLCQSEPDTGVFLMDPKSTFRPLTQGSFRRACETRTKMMNCPMHK